MALTQEQRKLLAVALGSRKDAQDLASQIADMIDAGGNAVAADVADIADPGTATAEDVANKVNELMASLRAAGILA